MFEQSRRRSPVPLALAAVGVLVVAAGAWWTRQAPQPSPPSTSASAPAPAGLAREGSEAEIRAELRVVLDALPGGTLYHLACEPLPCVATVRIPVPKGSDASYRSRFEDAWKARGWTLSPPGEVHVLDPRRIQDGSLPERAFYTLAIRGGSEPLDDAGKAEIRDRVSKQAGDAVNAFEPW